jgi:hypothetical protein
MLNPALGSVGVTVNLTVPATTVSGEGDLPGELAGYGPIDAGQARELAGWGRNLTNDRPRVTNGCTRAHGAGISTSPVWKIIADPKWKRMITDPVTGSLVDYDAKTYRPPAAIANLVRARDRYCVFPSCSIPSNSCDLDHRVPYPQGPTTADNLAPLCRGHHRLSMRVVGRYSRTTEATCGSTPPASNTPNNPNQSPNQNPHHRPTRHHH